MLRWLFTQGEAEASVHHARKLVTTTGLDFQTVGQDHLWCARLLGLPFSSPSPSLSCICVYPSAAGALGRFRSQAPLIAITTSLMHPAAADVLMLLGSGGNPTSNKHSRWQYQQSELIELRN